MELSSQVCSLELAKKLKELGVEQNSLFYWSENAAYGWQIVNDRYPKEDCYENGMTEGISAFTVAELGELLPDDVVFYKNNYGNCEARHLIYVENGYPLLCKVVEPADTEANARAKCLIYLIERGIVKV